MTIAFILIKIDYKLKAKEIIIGINASLEGYKGYFRQRDLKNAAGTACKIRERNLVSSKESI